MTIAMRQRHTGKEKVQDGGTGILSHSAGHAVVGINMRAKTNDPLRPAVTIAGAGTSLVAACFLAEAFERECPRARIKVHGSMGSAALIRAVADGLITMGVTAHAKDDNARGWGLTTLSYARTGIVFGAHPSVPEEGITSDALLEICRGIKTRWQDGQEIVLLHREPGNCFMEVLAAHIPGLWDAYQSGRTRITVYTDQEMNRAIATTPQAIGITDSGLLRSQRLPVKVLRFNGIAPTLEGVRAGRYPLVKTLTLVFRKERLSVEALAFLCFICSKDGAKVLHAQGYLPGE
ncbi:MAG TPA: substrate-binding domain-containing protein [Candidatus Methylomirabilis sp.]|nr:substrate-binding domain-containing protein [Candidatus Methylomirabilis sp.]